MLAADFDDRVDALDRAFGKCGACERDGNHCDGLVASCRLPDKMICHKCVSEFHDTFRDGSRFNELHCGTDCDFCDVPPKAAVALIRKSSICICDSCLNICLTIADPKFQSKRKKKESQTPTYCKLLRIEFDIGLRLQEFMDSPLHRRLTAKQFSRIVNRRRIPKRWRHKFEDDELNSRLELLEKIIYSTYQPGGQNFDTRVEHDTDDFS